MIGWFSPNAILESTDSQLEGLPVDNITTRRLHSGFFGRYRLKIAVWVYAKPLRGDHSYHLPAKGLTAFADAQYAGKVSQPAASAS